MKLPLLCTGLTALLTAVPAGFGAPPIEPLPTPAYSFDLFSPTVQGGFVDAGDVLIPGSIHPERLVPRELLGLFSLLDDLDGLSGSNASAPPLQPFLLLFSVDRLSVGVAPPDPLLVSLDCPYNVLDQAEKGQAAGDQYMSTTAFMLMGASAGGGRPANNSLGRNNYDEGGVDFTALPPTSADDHAVRVPQDNVQGTISLPPGWTGPTAFPIYFTVSRDSPSLLSLPGGSQPSGAHIFFNPDPLHGASTQLYAHFHELGLIQQDDIDALIVFDVNQDGIFDPPDQVLFSLTPDSPSLGTIYGASPTGAAADVFRASRGQPLMVFAPAGVLGLGDPLDNIDALDYSFCYGDPVSCVALHCIRVLRGDLNCDGRVDNFDITPFVLALIATPPNFPEYYSQYPDCNRNLADVNRDGNVDNFDITPFVALLIRD